MSKILGIVIAAFNEQERLSGSVKEILWFIETEKLNAELIVVDDASSDETSEVARN